MLLQLPMASKPPILIKLISNRFDQLDKQPIRLNGHYFAQFNFKNIRPLQCDIDDNDDNDIHIVLHIFL